MTSLAACLNCSVRNRSFCGTLDAADLATLGGLGRRQKLSQGDAVLWAGQDADICGNVLHGALELIATTSDGRAQNVGALYPGDFIGHPYADAAAFTVTAITESEICTFPRAPFERLLARDAKLERQLLVQTLATLDATRARILTLTRRTAAEKVAGFLLEIAERGETVRSKPSPTGPLTFDLPLNRGQIADVLGLTIETVSRQLTKLKAAGIIALPGVRAVTIRQEAALKAIAG